MLHLSYYPQHPGKKCFNIDITCIFLDMIIFVYISKYTWNHK